MHIAVNTRFLIPGTFEGFGHYTHELLSRMVTAHPEDVYDFYFDRRIPHQFLYTDQVHGHTLFPPARHPLLFYLWYQWTLRHTLRKTGPDVFFSPDSFMPLGLKIPAVITVHDVAHRHYPEGVSWAHRKYYDVFMPKFIREAKRIITVSRFSRDEILQYYPEAEGKVEVVYNGVGPEYAPLDENAQQEIRDWISAGTPYFLFVGAIHPRKNVAGLINAYAHYRRIHKTKTKLVIVGRKSWDYADVNQATQQSGVFEDIIFTGYVPMEKLAGITASALALCYISLYEGFGLPVAEAMQCGVPVIVTSGSAQAEVAGDAGIAVNPKDASAVAEAMATIERDSALRADCIARGIARSAIFSWDASARKTYDVLNSAVS